MKKHTQRITSMEAANLMLRLNQTAQINDRVRLLPPYQNRSPHYALVDSSLLFEVTQIAGSYSCSYTLCALDKKAYDSGKFLLDAHLPKNIPSTEESHSD